MIRQLLKHNLLTKIFSFSLLLLFLVLMMPVATFASKNETQVSNIAFTSDVHGKTKNLTSWLSGLSKDGISRLDYMVFGGDMADTFQSDNIIALKKIVVRQYPSARNIFTMGNHEWKGSGNDKAFTKVTGNTRTGIQVKKDNYMIYTLGAASEEQKFKDKDIKALDTCLAKVDSRMPVFIVSHYPLHMYQNSKRCRKTKNVKHLINVLNKYPNVIFLWGHNHSIKDTNYGTIKSTGDTIEYKNGKKAAINFTYANLGCMKDGAGQHVYGLLAVVESKKGNRIVKLQYRNKSTAISFVKTISFSEDTAGKPYLGKQHKKR